MTSKLSIPAPPNKVKPNHVISTASVILSAAKNLKSQFRHSTPYPPIHPEPPPFTLSLPPFTLSLSKGEPPCYTNHMTKTIYLANPYGFSQQQRALLLPPIVAALEELGLEVWEPFARNNQVDFSQEGWAYQVGQLDYSDVVESDATFAIVNGVPPDEGVMVELGMAIALKKPTFLFRDDFRRASESDQYPLNLMLFTGLPEKDWRDYYYTSVNEITSPEKALARWAKAPRSP